MGWRHGRKRKIMQLNQFGTLIKSFPFGKRVPWGGSWRKRHSIHAGGGRSEKTRGNKAIKDFAGQNEGVMIDMGVLWEPVEGYKERSRKVWAVNFGSRILASAWQGIARKEKTASNCEHGQCLTNKFLNILTGSNVSDFYLCSLRTGPYYHMLRLNSSYCCKKVLRKNTLKS